MKARFNDVLWKEMCEMHALPDGWESMTYQEFLNQRRLMIAGVIKREDMTRLHKSQREADKAPVFEA